ncbi:MAG: PDZ domain-containing protein [bacterium]|nr:PDZ domain-containing protein [bacterium]
MIKTFCLIFFVLLFCFQISAAPGATPESPILRSPSLNPDGSQIAFSYQGDIWTVAADGGRALRITIHNAYDTFPKWNKAGNAIAFSSNRFGNDDIFVVPAVGGLPKQLTYFSGGDRLNQWTADGTLYFTSSRLFRQVERFPEILTIPADGGTPVRKLDVLGYQPVMSPDKNFIAFVRGSCRITREAYRGSANRDIWLYNVASKKYSRLTEFNGNDFCPRWGENGTLYYISSQSGKYNVHALTPGKTADAKQITDFKEFGVRYLEISADGKRLVLERKNAIYTLAASGGEPAQVKVDIASDYRFDPKKYKTYSKGAEDYVISPNGKYTAFIVRGEVFLTKNDKEKSRTVNLSDHPYRDMDPAWLTDKAVIFSSDREGVRNLYMVTSADKKEAELFKTLKLKTTRLTNEEKPVTYPVMSPDRKKIAFLKGKGELVVADISDKGVLSNQVTLLNGWATINGICWSPDGKWLSYSKVDLDYNEEVFIHAADNGRKPVNVSMHPRMDMNPVWSPDGSKLGFSSQRNGMNVDIWFVWLRKKDWEKTKRDWDEFEEEPAKSAKKDTKDKKDKKDKGKKAKDKKKEVKPVVIDFEDIHLRLVQVTNLAGDEGGPAISKDGKTFYYTARTPTAKKPDLYSITWDRKKPKAVTKGGQDPDGVQLYGSHLYLLKSGGRLARINTNGNKMESLPFSAKMVINFPEEKKQIFEEVCRVLGDRFYDPNFHGRDWKKLNARYKPLVEATSCDKDFRDMVNFMLGQLNASHMGLYGGDTGEIQKQTTGLLGVEIDVHAKGVQVKQVIPDSPAARLSGKLEKGDIILAVDGQAIKKEINFYSLLINKVGERVLLEVENASGVKREVVIRPTRSLKNQLYDQWVNRRRSLTEKHSKGRLGYLHIRGMDMVSFERFERELTAAGYGKEGIVIDVRFNGGGWTTDYLMAVLSIKQHAYTVPRGSAANLEKEHKKFRNHYAFGERLPFPVWTRPSIALCNANSYSNAEIFSHAFKTLGFGTLVGVPTFGAVISTGGRMMINDFYVRLPHRGWFVKATDENMEHIPATPDIIVHNTPESKAQGRDQQLERAVAELLKQIDK